MALPLIAHGRVIGVLDVQSVEPELSRAKISRLRVLADQLAVAIENARLFGESQRVLRELKAAQGLELLHGWAERLEHAAATGIRSRVWLLSRLSISQAAGRRDPGFRAQCLDCARKVAGTQIGALRLRRDLEHPWTGREINFVQRAVQD
jgi:signal transduction protein with GAF and PtsI domain